MSDRPRTSVLFAAVDVAMRAKAGGVDASEVTELQARAEQVLGAEDPARYAINKFATDFEPARYDPASQAALGATLHDAIERAMRPDPIDAGRADIHG